MIRRSDNLLSMSLQFQPQEMFQTQHWVVANWVTKYPAVGFKCSLIRRYLKNCENFIVHRNAEILYICNLKEMDIPFRSGDRSRSLVDA